MEQTLVSSIITHGRQEGARSADEHYHDNKPQAAPEIT
jgi:hypothetical protein